jgi:DNA-binding MarR family transcriptional regulator
MPTMPDHPPEPAPPHLPKRLPVLLRRAWYGLNQSFRQRVQHLGITPDQFSILRWLSEGDPQGLTQRTLTDLMASDPNTITSTLSRMESAGSIVRHPHETDRRARRVQILPAGRKTFEQARKVAQELQEQMLGALPADERTRFLERLEAIADACANATARPVGKKRES